TALSYAARAFFGAARDVALTTASSPKGFGVLARDPEPLDIRSHSPICRCVSCRCPACCGVSWCGPWKTVSVLLFGACAWAIANETVNEATKRINPLRNMVEGSVRATEDDRTAPEGT
ncbi:MAG: hypothetical protein O2795_19885, partial [Acidobacteria bacterium]|nr:hypothetical protein [Acidobacteriota bacterium]